MFPALCWMCALINQHISKWKRAPNLRVPWEHLCLSLVLPVSCPTPNKKEKKVDFHKCSVADSKSEVISRTAHSRHSKSSIISLWSSLGILSNNAQKRVCVCVCFTKIMKSGVFLEWDSKPRQDNFFLLQAAEKVIHAFIAIRLDCCSSLYSDLSIQNIRRLQLI